MPTCRRTDVADDSHHRRVVGSRTRRGARAVARRPHRLRQCAASRKHGGDRLSRRPRPTAVDVTVEADLERAVQTIVEEQRRIDVLINNAGQGLYAAAEDMPLEEARHQFEVNLFGPARLTQLVLPHMRAQRSGRILNVSSMGARSRSRSAPGITPLSMRWKGIQTHSGRKSSASASMSCSSSPASPGPSSAMSPFGRLREHSGRGAYRELAEALARNTETMYGQNSRASDPTVVAKAIRKAVESRDPSTAEEHKAQTQVTTNGYRPDFPVCGSTSRRGTGSFPFLCGRGTARTR